MMNIVRTAIREIFGMFIDDGALALWSMILIFLVAAAVEFGGLPGLAGGIMLLAGCILILAESTFRAARKKPEGQRRSELD
ncbi:hypothetical protein FVA77_06395 [Phyllobacterium endophyticum]|nr:hypothetical protein [Phyllobacterium endophyticum]TXR50120.1 hypothetical protein FVA77_06395 [Phyllobacterium endophyticum]